MLTQIITPPAAYPITLAEAKAFCRIESDQTAEDAVLTMLIAAMTDYAEHLTGRAFVERTVRASLDYFPHCIELPYAPLLEVITISYIDINGDAQTVSSANYEVNNVSEPGKVRPVEGASWPSIGYGFNPVQITYRAGYRPTGSPTDLTNNSYIPQLARTWMQARIATLYDNREQIVSGTIVNDLPRDYVDGLLDSLILGTRLF
jgi:uncharacterized phiE125 gp8 family phage protein